MHKLFFRWPDKKSENGGVKDGVPVHQDIIVYDFDQVCFIGTESFANGTELFRN